MSLESISLAFIALIVLVQLYVEVNCCVVSTIKNNVNISGIVRVTGLFCGPGISYCNTAEWGK